MALIWLVAKYVPDLVRCEPKNVGLFVFDNDELLKTRFIGELEDDTVDARLARWARSSDNYKAWVRHWKSSARDGRDALTAAHGRDDNYYVEVGGERLAGEDEDWETIFSQLYVRIVEESRPEPTLSLERAAEKALRGAGIWDRIARDAVVPVPDDRVTFDYRYDNGAPHLMKRVALSWDDERSWDTAHAAIYAFDKAKRALTNAKGIAMVRGKLGAPGDFTSQVSLLGHHARVIDVSRDSAIDELRAALN